MKKERKRGRARTLPLADFFAYCELRLCLTTRTLFVCIKIELHTELNATEQQKKARTFVCERSARCVLFAHFRVLLVYLTQ